MLQSIEGQLHLTIMRTFTRLLKIHPWLAQKVVSRSAHLADTLLSKASTGEQMQGHC